MNALLRPQGGSPRLGVRSRQAASRCVGGRDGCDVAARVACSQRLTRRDWPLCACSRVHIHRLLVAGASSSRRAQVRQLRQQATTARQLQLAPGTAEQQQRSLAGARCCLAQMRAPHAAYRVQIISCAAAPVTADEVASKSGAQAAARFLQPNGFLQQRAQLNNADAAPRTAPLQMPLTFRATWPPPRSRSTQRWTQQCQQSTPKR